jgi:integrase
VEGSVGKYETSRGVRWRYRIELPPDPKSGARRQAAKRGFATKREASVALRAAIAQLEGGEFTAATGITLSDYIVDTWLPSMAPREVRSGRRHRGTVSAATHHVYCASLARYVLPRIGAVRLQALTPMQLGQLYDELEVRGGRGGRPLSSKSVANVAGVVHKALADAVRLGLLHHNPADSVSPPSADKPENDWWSIAELRAFLTHVRDHDLYAAWLLLATTGARRGEVAGLTWDDLDLDAGRVRISWTLGHVAHKMTWQVRPKSKAGERTMALDPATVSALRDHKARQDEVRAHVGTFWPDGFTDWQGRTRTGLLWTYPDGSPIHPKTITEWFLRLSAEAGLRRIRLHDVRHSYASAALERATGWHDVKVISQRLGHANIGITLDTYSHVLPAADEHAANTLAELILGTDVDSGP